MSSLLNESDLCHESAVVLLVLLANSDELDCVRQALDRTPRRRGKPCYERDGRMVGNTDLDGHAEADPYSGLQHRRVFFFFLLPHGCDANPDREGVPAKPSPPTIELRRGGDKPHAPNAIAADRRTGTATPAEKGTNSSSSSALIQYPSGRNRRANRKAHWI
ncbi:DUF6009 family protein [Streptomyces sp. HB132]|uniref:DUF6009 family protein n=1 Tax=Streptomyces sp. HB132 TaxID=767388 RepID=UPI001D658FF3|nr:hypothetical protein [Streptomyces sp. HB132]